VTVVEQAIRQLRARLGDMFDRLDEQLADTVNALASSDQALAQEVRAGDAKIDALALENDHHCVEVLDTCQPQGAALHVVIASMRIGSSLERIGDQCKNACKALPEVSEITGWESSTDVLDIADAARRSLRAARDAFADHDRIKARQVLAYDRQIDRAYRETLDTIAAFGDTGNTRPRALINLASISKSFERIADHAKSIARSVVYALEGVDIRYSGLPEQERPPVQAQRRLTNPFAHAAS